MRTIIAVALVWATGNCLGQPAQQQPPTALTGETPPLQIMTPADAVEQVRRLTELQQSSEDVTKVRAELEDLKRQFREGQLKDQRILREKECEEHRAFLKLRAQSLAEWAGVITGLDDGLAAAQGIGTVSEIGILFRPEESPKWVNSLDNLGKIVAGFGGAFAIAAPNDSSRNDGLTAAAGGIALYFASNYLKSYFSKNDDADRLKLFVERISMHKNFASDILAIKGAVEEARKQLKPLAAPARQLLRNPDIDKYVAYPMNATTVDQYKAAIATYDVLVAQFQSAKQRATYLLTDAPEFGWNQKIVRDLKNIETSTGEAIDRWREHILISGRLSKDLEQIAARKLPEKDPCAAVR